jgi:hypothetical protein
LNRAFLLVDPESESDLKKITSDYPEVKEITKISGDHPYMLRVETRGLDRMKVTVKDIRHSHSIKSTVCLLTVEPE